MSHTIDVRVRRRPKYSVFMGVGVVLGFIVAPLLAMQDVELINPNEEYSFLAVTGFLAAVLGVTGLILGAVVALVLERLSARRHRDYTVPAYYERTGLRPEAEETGEDPGDTADLPDSGAETGPEAGGAETGPDAGGPADEAAGDPATTADPADPDDQSRGK